MIASLPVGRRLAVSVAVLLAAVATVLAVTVPGSLGAYTAKVTNSADTVATNSAFTCAAAAYGGTAGPLAYVTYPMAEASGTVATDATGNNRPGAYTSTGVTYGAAGPCPGDTGRAVTFNGSSGYLSGPASTLLAQATISEEVWFRTTTGGGKLLGFGLARTGGSLTTDRNVYLTNAGNVVFAVQSGLTTQTPITSPGTYLNGQWHHVVATQTNSGANIGMRLYVDGALVASNTAITTYAALTGYWRIAYDTLTGWPSAPTSTYFNGSMAWASLYLGSALTPDQVTSHYVAGRPRPTTSGKASFSPSASTTADQYIRHFNYELFVNTITPASSTLDRNDATFTMVAGLADSSCVSFVSLNYPGYYIRHNDVFRLRIDPSDGSAVFNQDATFCPQTGNNGKGTTWRSWDEPTRFWRVYQGALYVAANGGPNAFDTTTGFADDTSFNTNSPLI